ncbi:hypothetical protein XENTR_v10001668 [Xenopus tropicalis]|nr:hypothetical protein XENTR_v10001668 [Xenopus tropicalis]
MQSLNITPEQYARLLQENNVIREQFIELYQLQPLPELPFRTKITSVSKAMRTVTNIFIWSLALSDLRIAFFCIPFTMLQNISNWLGGKELFACKMVPFVQSTAIVTEILTMTCIAVKRHQGIVYPLKMKWQFTNRRAFTMLGIVWLIAAVGGIPMWHAQRLELTHFNESTPIFAIVQIIAFFNSICNPIVYAFMNENFKKNFLSALCFCFLRDPSSPARRPGNSGITLIQQKSSSFRRENTCEDARREVFSEGNIEVKFFDQPV